MTAARLVDRLLCDRCGRSPLTGDCSCLAVYSTGVQAAVQLRHRASVQLAREHDRWRARHGAVRYIP